VENNRIKLVISDFHLSAGARLADGTRNPLEDFREDQKFAEFLEHYSMREFAEVDVELIINGDFLDPLAVLDFPVKAKRFRVDYSREVLEDPQVEKIRTIVAGHPVTFAALKDFLYRGKRIVYRWGNHDVGILWPKVEQYLRSVLDPPRPEQLVFQIERYIFDRICIDHGHQYEVINHFDDGNIFIERETRVGVRKILNLPFGSFFVLGFFNRIKLTRPYVYMVQPLRQYLKLAAIFDPVFFISNGFRVFWFFVKMRFVTHPMRYARFNKTVLILKELLKRPSLEEAAEDELTQSDASYLDYDTLIMGHDHQAKVRVFRGGKQYINTGTWTPITSLDMTSLGHRILRTYALIEYREGRAVASLRIWNGLPQVSEEFQ